MTKDSYRNSLEERYRQQQRQAKHRGLGWEFSFETWLEIWTESGKLHLRGKGAGRYVMARRGDVGPYSAANCFICPFEQNIRDGHKSAAVKPKKTQRIARGWTFVKKTKARPYQVMVGPRYIGSFATQAEAEAAFKEAREAKASHAQSFGQRSLSTPLNEVAGG